MENVRILLKYKADKNTSVKKVETYFNTSFPVKIE